MVSIIHSPGSTPQSNNTSSSGSLFSYLSKEDEKKDFFDRTGFFNSEEDKVSKLDATKEIDQNKGRLGKDEYKFYMVTINPSQKELNHLLPKGKDNISKLDPKELKQYESKLQDFTRSVMDNYADSFNKGLKGDDLVYYGKIEHERTYKGNEKEVQNGQVKSGDKKLGRQSHIHVVVSRYDKTESKKLSPLSKSRAKANNTKLGDKTTQQGFNHEAFKQANEKTFDKQHNYQREKSETFSHAMEQKGNDKKLVASKSENFNSGMEQKELAQMFDTSNPIQDAKQLSQNQLSPMEYSGINQKQREQDAQQIYSKELKKMNPIAKFLKDETIKIKEAITYAGNY